MKMSGKEAYSLILRGFPDIMNVSEMCTALSISTKTEYVVFAKFYSALYRVRSATTKT